MQGCLSDEFLADLELAGERDLALGETRLWVASPDQAGLYGVLNRLRDLGLTLVAVQSIFDAR